MVRGFREGFRFIFSKGEREGIVVLEINFSWLVFGIICFGGGIF